MNASMDDFQEPDEARPAKRARLEAPLQITEHLQEEMVDNEEDWDDIYGISAEQSATSLPASEVVSLPQAEHIAETPVAISNFARAAEDGLPLDAIDGGDGLDVDHVHVTSTDAPSAKVIDETTQIQRQTPHQIEKPPPKLESGKEQHPAKEATEIGAQTAVDGVVSPSSPVEPSVTSHPPKDDAEFLQAAAAQKNNQEAEWQFDSSDAESSVSDSDSSSDDSDDSDSGSEGGYELLDPATAAKMLMAGDGEDEDGDKSKDKTNGDRQPRTANETKEEIVPKPNVVVTADMKVTHLGTVDRVVDNLVLIKAVTPGEYQVLESGSVLCTEDRQVIGAVADTLGRVQEPLYSVAFTNSQEIDSAGLVFGTKVFYVDSHSTFVFTQPLKNMKGTDASNIHDEEVGEDELEFSDDEEEAEYKRLRKLSKKEGRGTLSRGAYNEAKAAGIVTTVPPVYDRGQAFASRSDAPQQQYGSGINYDDVDAQEEFYSPLKRPDNLSQLMAGGGPPRAHSGGFERGRGRGRGDRGRGRGDRGGGRGGFDHRGGREARRGQHHERGPRGQQHGHRGSAHSYPDRHNNRGADPSPPPAAESSRASPPSANQPPQYQPYPQHQNQQRHPMPSSQSYQFNGYTFQYGNAPPEPTVYHNQHSSVLPSSGPPFAVGSNHSPVSFGGQQPWPLVQTQVGYAHYPQQQQQSMQPSAAQTQYAGVDFGGGVQLQQHQKDNLAEILRQLNGGPSR